MYISLGFASSNPSWFYNMNLKQNQIIGYGESAELSKAKATAKNEIASIISTKVDSYLKIDKTIDKNGLNRKVEKSIKVSTNIKLEELNIIKSKFINDKWYVAISYDYSPFAVKFKKLLLNYKLKDQKQNDFLKHTNLVKNLNTVVGKRLNYKLHSKNNLWYLSYKESSLKLGKSDFNNLFAFKNSSIINLELNQDKYMPNDSLILDISAKKSGNISIFYIGNNGQIGVLKDNISINKNITYPNGEKIILKNHGKKDRKFMIVVLYSKDKIDLQDFDKVSKSEIKNASFVELLKYFNKYEYLTYVSQVSPK